MPRKPKHDGDSPAELTPQQLRNVFLRARKWIDGKRADLDALDVQLREAEAIHHGAGVPPGTAARQLQPGPAPVPGPAPAPAPQPAPVPAQPNIVVRFIDQFVGIIKQWSAEGDVLLADPRSEHFLLPVEMRGARGVEVAGAESNSEDDENQV